MDAHAFGRTPGTIGEFGTPPDDAAALASPLYLGYELFHAAMQPARLLAEATRRLYGAPLNPFAASPLARSTVAGAELFERATRRYAKPAFGITATTLDGRPVAVAEEAVWQQPFCRLLHFRKAAAAVQPKVLVVAPMSGHFATLVRGTVTALLPGHDVYVTDWADARTVPLAAGRFDLDDYVDYLVELFGRFGGDCHVVAVCQPAVPVLAATALLEAAGDPRAPRSMVLMGGPIDTRINPTAVNRYAEAHGLDWFRSRVIAPVPPPHPGAGRLVYPGFLQLGGFVAMNLDRHITAHWRFFENLVAGDGDSADKHRAFYDEYMAVMDLTAEFYLQTVDQVFIRHALPKGELTHRGTPVRPEAIRRTALMTVEGERDDISGVGQTEAAHRLCTGIPAERRRHWLQPGVGHYGVFNGARFEAETLPRIADFIRMAEAG
ncbi:MAG TPA: polyhydroxyalkanoate depolymerase [Hyphomicrobiales bacterium]|nr:polyhydroxyalkanoate depolymerase [Hyphomicrobiales bacterium]